MFPFDQIADSNEQSDDIKLANQECHHLLLGILHSFFFLAKNYLRGASVRVPPCKLWSLYCGIKASSKKLLSMLLHREDSFCFVVVVSFLSLGYGVWCFNSKIGGEAVIVSSSFPQTYSCQSEKANRTVEIGGLNVLFTCKRTLLVSL